jgi:hypothetical protein
MNRISAVQKSSLHLSKQQPSNARTNILPQQVTTQLHWLNAGLDTGDGLSNQRFVRVFAASSHQIPNIKIK